MNEFSPRQQAAHDLIATNDGVTADQIGANWHAIRGRHAAASRCEWCHTDPVLMAEQPRTPRTSTTRRKTYVKTPLRDRFLAKIERGDPEDCWEWLGFIDKGGYGRIRDAGGRSGESAYAHRVSYELFTGPIPAGLVIDHLCGNRWCVNPTHLEPVTSAENTRRGDTAYVLQTGKCDRGHERLLHGYRSPNGHYHCLECKRQKRLGLAVIGEREHQRSILELLQMLGWRAAHFRPAMTSKGWRTPVAADGEGFPDLVIVRDRLVFLELKTESGRLSDPQKDWLRALHTANAEAYIVRPHDLQLLAQVLGRRYRIETLLEAQTRDELSIEEGTTRP